ncbi:hypothetical protein [Dictyobacter arantiisoli]|uniref:hypothetical protein n=1 Tax=Dictyobacter arantiisoli TaxID=2014874 RepID=UPI0011EEDA88|nr:hypothetical protein [Dictyobacter arantiisoli]
MPDGSRGHCTKRQRRSMHRLSYDQSRPTALYLTPSTTMGNIRMRWGEMVVRGRGKRISVATSARTYTVIPTYRAGRQ